jgi:phosphoglycolate phosphatase
LASDLSDLSVIFDLDGTLVDSAPDLTAALNHVLKQERRPIVSTESVRHMVGRGARVLIQEVFADHKGPPPDEVIDRHLQNFLDYYAQHIADDSRAFPGVVDTLTLLQQANVPMGVCTNKREVFATALLDQLDLTQFFGAIVGADTLAVHKPDPLHFWEAVDRIGGDRNRAVMVGDSATDVATARAASAPVVVVSFGYTPTSPRELGGDALIDHFSELTPAIKRLM